MYLRAGLRGPRLILREDVRLRTPELRELVLERGYLKGVVPPLLPEFGLEGRDLAREGRHLA